MTSIELDINEAEAEQLAAAAAQRELTSAALVSRWVRERLAHERERAAGGGEPRSPRARREQQEG
jgi:hypothetical protein